MKGLVYEIFCNQTGMRYIGSTIASLEERILQHIYHNKRYKLGKTASCSSFQILDGGDYTVSILENVEYENVIELRVREQFFLETLNNINVIRAYCSKETHRADNIEYYKTNAVIIKEYHKGYRQANADKLSEQKKVYNQANAVKISDKNKVYYKANAVRINEYNKEYNRVYSKVNAVKISEQKKVYYKRKRAQYALSKLFLPYLVKYITDRRGRNTSKTVL